MTPRGRPTMQRRQKQPTLIRAALGSLRNIQLLTIQQRPARVIHALIIRARTQQRHAVLDIRKEHAAAGAERVAPERDGEAGESALGEWRGHVRAHPVRGVGVRGEGVSAAREEFGVGRDWAGWVDTPGGEDGEGVPFGGGGGGGECADADAEEGEGEEEDGGKHGVW